MLTDIPVLAVALALLAVVVGLQIYDTIRRGGARRRGAASGLATVPAPLMSPQRWAAVGVVIVLLGLFWPAPRGTRGFAPTPEPAPTTPPKGKSAASPSTDAGNPGGAERVPSNATAGGAGRVPSNATGAGTAASVPDQPAPDTAATSLSAVEAAAEERRWLNQGDRMMAAGQPGMAVQAYWEALRVQPQSQRARSGLARARRVEAEAETARIETQEAERAASELTPSWSSEMPRERPAPPAKRSAAPAGSSRWNSQEDARFHNERGDRLLQQGRAQAAITEYEKALESDPSDARAREGLAEARRQAAGSR